MNCEQGAFAEAEAIAARLAVIAPGRSEPHMLLGRICLETNRRDDAVVYLGRAVALAPQSSALRNECALSLKEAGQFDQALQEYAAAIALDPENPYPHNYRGILYLLRGDYAQGLPEYEWRKKTREKYGERDLAAPLWLGQDLSGKTLVVHHEQGMGDAIQLSRFIPYLQRRGVDVVYDAHPPLRRLLSSMGDVRFATLGDPELRYDYHCPIASIPLAINLTFENIPRETPYLFAEPARVVQWREKLGREKRGAGTFTIGVATQGSNSRWSMNRSFSLRQLVAAIDLPGLRIVSLNRQQPGAPVESDLAEKVVFLGPEYDLGPDAFLDAAAVIDCCDLVISCDTSLAHLAGAMNRPTWVVLRDMPHWPWLLERSDSPWYPGVRLFRQKAPGDWESAFAELRQALAQRLSGDGA